MKFLVVLVVVLGCSASAQRFSATQNGNEIVITRSENENNGDGTFRWLSELSDGTKLSQSGYVKPGPDPENPIQVIQGAFSYISPEGQQIDLSYTADENGFQPIASHLPTPPPVPEAIQKALSAAASQIRPVQVPVSRNLQQPRRF